MQPTRAGTSGIAPLFGARDRRREAVDGGQHRPVVVPDMAQLPFVGPIVRRGLADHVAGRLIRDRLLRLLARVAEAQAQIRTERAQEMSGRINTLKRHLEQLEIKDVASADALFSTVGRISKELEAIIDDADYLSFRTLGTLSQLRAANLALRTSRVLWQSIRVGDAVRDPEIFPRALHLIESTEQLSVRAFRGEDVRPALGELEKQYSTLARDIEMRAGDSGLGKGSAGIRVSRRVWDYRMALEKAALERQGSADRRMTNGELLGWVREHGLPPEVIAQLLEEDVAKQLLAFANSEGTARNSAVESLSSRARALAEQVRSIDPAILRDVDRLEPLVRDLGAELDRLLDEAERIVRPLDGPVKMLRAANDALRAIRGLFTAMRLARALEDPTFRGQAEDLAERVRKLGDEGGGRYDARLAAIETGLQEFEDQLKARLKIDSVPLAGESARAMKTARRVARFREALQDAAKPEVLAGLHALSDLDMRPEDRARIYQKAQGEPLLDAVVNVIVASRQLELGFTFADAGRAVNDMLRIGGSGGDLNPQLARSPLAFLGNANFEQAFGELDLFLKNADTPDGRALIDNSLNVFRAAARVEAGNVERVALFVPPEHRAYLAAEVTEWVGRTSLALIQFLGGELSEPGGEAFADVLDAVISTTEHHLDAMIAQDPRELGKAHLEDLKSSVQKRARSEAAGSGQSQLIDALTKLNDRDLDNTPLRELPALNAKLAEALTCVETTGDSRDAMRAILGDVSSSARMLVHLVHLFGAASNDRMDEAKRAAAIQSSVEKMGPLFVKMMQTLVNMQSLLARVTPDQRAAETDPLFSALKKLQDECTPLPWSVVKEEIERSLGQPVEEAFLWIDEDPLKAGSIGQTHRAKIRTPEGEIANVVIKVLRPGIDENFAETIRVTQLTLSVFRELLRLDGEGAIFGELKARAEATLPMLERALSSFIESFRIETNFTQEADNMRVGSSRVDLQACKLEYSIVSPK